MLRSSISRAARGGTEAYRVRSLYAYMSSIVCPWCFVLGDQALQPTAPNRNFNQRPPSSCLIQCSDFIPDRPSQDNSSVKGDFAYIATGFGCVACALTFVLTWRFGQIADHALVDRFERKASLVVVHTAISPP